MESTAEQLFDSLRTKIPDLKATLLISAAGGVGVHAASGFEFDGANFATEYAMLFRIARRTAEDTAMGSPLEQILISDKAIVVARRVGVDDVVLFVCGPDEQLGRLRYETRRVAENLVVRVT
jgi:predicted regulator of Ras-like GTPase activity (Roadblock/LC7/MglB family)